MMKGMMRGHGKTDAWSRRGFLLSAGTAAAGFCAGAASGVEAAVPLVTFGVVADCHFADREPLSGRYYRESAGKLAECVSYMNNQGVDFLVELGDFKDQGQTPEATVGFLRTIEAVFRKFRGARYHVLGNHDTDSIAKERFLENIENTGIPRMRSYYSFDVERVHFVALDANFRADGSPYNSGNFDWRAAYVPPEQIAWLEEDLGKTERPAIVFIHQLLDADEGDVFVRNASGVRRVLERSGKVRAVFQGHHHEGRYTRRQGIHYYTLKALITGSGVRNSAYAVVDVYADGGLRVTGLEKADSRQLVAPGA